MKKKIRSNAAFVNDLIVYKNGEVVGTGHMVYTLHNGAFLAPVLIGLDGNPLPEDWYELIIKEQHLTILSTRTH